MAEARTFQSPDGSFRCEVSYDDARRLVSCKVEGKGKNSIESARKEGITEQWFENINLDKDQYGPEKKYTKTPEKQTMHHARPTTLHNFSLQQDSGRHRP